MQWGFKFRGSGPSLASLDLFQLKYRSISHPQLACGHGVPYAVLPHSP